MTSTTPIAAVDAGDEQASRFDVIIGGSGFAGMALALALAEGLPPGSAIPGSAAGVHIALVDRDGDKPANAGIGPRDGRAVALAASSVRLLTALGVWQAIEHAAEPVSGIEITDSALKAGIRPVLLSYDTRIGGDELERGEASMQIVPLAALEAALSTSIARRAEITVLRGRTIASFASGPERVSVVLDDGGVLDAPLLVACDGRRSKLREMAGIGTVGWDYHQHGITVVVAHDEPHHSKAVQHFLPGGPFALLPLPGNRTCVTWSEGSKEAARIMALDDAGFLEELDRRVAGRLGSLRIDGPRQSWPLDVFLARDYVKPRFVLVGDAAHGVHPIAGQGLNLALKDVAALVEVAVDQARLGLDLGAPEALSRYERWRRFDTMTAAAGFDALNRLFSNDIGLLRSLRSLGLELVDRAPLLKRHLVDEAAGINGTLPRLLRGHRV